METHFGDKKIKYDENLSEFINHFHLGMTEKEREDLFYQAKHSPRHSVDFSPRHDVHLRLSHHDEGYYSLEKV